MGHEQALVGGEEHEHLMAKNRVAIPDAGAQLADVIRWQLVEVGIRADIIPFTRGSEPLNAQAIKQNYGAVIYTGSGESVNDRGAPQIPFELLDSAIPSLGICYGAQAIAKAVGGDVGKVEIDGHHHGEYGVTEIAVDSSAVMYNGLHRAKVLMSHGDTIKHLPRGFEVTGRSGAIIASFESDDGRIVGTQFHPEVAETEGGVDMMVRFLKETAGIVPDSEYTLEVALDEYMEQEEAKIAEKLEQGSEIRGFLSGGVDSRVASEAVVRVAKRLNRLNQVKFFYVDTGHNRIEDDTIIDQMQADGMPVEKIDAAHEFFHTRVYVTPKVKETYLAPELVDEADPEIKRQIIGNIFRQVSERIMNEAQGDSDVPVYFVQGSNASDIIESGGRGGKQIKGHHNVEAMDDLRKASLLIEPLHGLMKYHVRHVGEHRYGLPERVFKRQPFPGVGESPRVIVNLTGELESSDPVLQARLDEIIQEKLGTNVRGHLVKMKTVGQKGDDRSIADAVFLEGVADWQDLDHLSMGITNRLASVNRVFFAHAGSIKRGGIKGVMVRDDEQFIVQLKRMEEVHRETMERLGLDRYLSQYFVGTLPIDLTGSGKPTLAVRHFITGANLKGMAERRSAKSKETFRTGIASLPGTHVDAAGFSEVLAALQTALADHGSIVYDLTGKPPGSTEWE